MSQPGLFPGMNLERAPNARSEKLHELARAKRVADALVEKLRPVCSRIEIAGSIRRECNPVHDIDLVLIPLHTVADLHKLVVAWADQGRVQIKKLGNKIIGLHLVKANIDADLYVCYELTWITTLLIRTGSKEHNIRLCKVAQQRGWTLHADGSGLENQDGRLHNPASEREVFMRLGLDYAPPERRES